MNLKLKFRVFFRSFILTIGLSEFRFNFNFLFFRRNFFRSIFFFSFGLIIVFNTFSWYIKLIIDTLKKIYEECVFPELISFHPCCKEYLCFNCRESIVFDDIVVVKLATSLMTIILHHMLVFLWISLILHRFLLCIRHSVE